MREQQLTADEKKILRDALRRELSVAEAFRARVHRRGKPEARDRCEAIRRLFEKIEQAGEVCLSFE